MKRLILFSLLLAGQVFGQTITQSSCASSATRGADIPNKSQQAISWRLTFWYTGFTAVTMEVDAAPDNGSGGAGTYAAMAGAFDGTTNPVTVNATPQAGTIAVKSYASHVAVFPSSVTGVGQVCWLITGLAGASVSPDHVVTTSGGGTSDVNLADVAGSPTATAGVSGLLAVGGAAADGANSAGNPVLIGGHDTATPNPKAHILQTDTFGDMVLAGVSAAQSDGSSNTPTIPGLGTSGSPVPSTNRSFPFKFNGSTWDRDFACTQSAEVALSGTGYTQIIAGSGSNVIRLCNIAVTSASAGAPVVNTFTLAFGTCAGAPTEIANLAGVTGYTDAFAGSLRGAAGAAFCVKEAVANSDKVTVTYASY